MTDAVDHPRAFYGRRKGRPLRPRRAELFTTLLPRLAVPLHHSAPNPIGALFEPTAQSIHLEIGIGGGEHLAAQAQAHPAAGFIGCEPFVNGMARALSLIDERALTNIRLHFGDAMEVIAWLPAGALACVDILYPDPWPKRRHWKRRFIHDDSVAALARVLACDGVLRFATDWPDYAAWTLERLLRSPYYAWTAERADDWRAPWPGCVRTRYEEKALRAGRRPCYLVFRRVG